MRGLLRLNTLVLLALSSGWAGTATASGDAIKPVRYRGYTIVVPRSWPVYDLASNPTVCVRFDRHAVYLGHPSAVERCPAHAVGRTEAILVEPLAAHSWRSSRAALAQVGNRDAQLRQGSSAKLTIPGRRLTIIATWRAHRRTIARALGSRWVAATRADGASTPAAGAALRRTPAVRARAAGAAAGAVYTGLGFDACSAPSASDMSAWMSSRYRATGIYVGGTNMACAQTNLTAQWVSAESAAGWHLIPTYVGLQAPTNGCGCAAIDPNQASTQGAAAASDAVNQTRPLGLGPGNPIYFDMEGYPQTHANTSAVLAFLSAWTSQLHSQGYKSGVYSSGGSGISDLAAARGTGVNEPNDIWVADWNGAQTTSFAYVPSSAWANHRRLHQYAGGHDESHGGVTINIDNDYLDGATAGSSGPSIPDGTFVQVAGSQEIYEIAGGAPLFLTPQYWATLGVRPLMTISQAQFDSLNPVPTGRTFLKTPAGALYRVAGGAPLFVSNPSLFTNVHPVTIDQWDIDNTSNPAAHLNPVPANGTFLTTTAGHIYRVAGGAPFAVSSWSVFGGARGSTRIDQWDIDNISNPAAHLRASPADGTAVKGLPSGLYWLFAGGRRRLTSARAGAVRVDDVGLAAFPAIPCVTPKLRHMTLLHARRALRRADCQLGKVHRRRRKPRRSVLHVIRQSPRARTTHAAAYAISVTLG